MFMRDLHADLVSGGCVGPIHLSSARLDFKNSGHIHAINVAAVKHNMPGPRRSLRRRCLGCDSPTGSEEARTFGAKQRIW
jgi:hypothetical protein